MQSQTRSWTILSDILLACEEATEVRGFCNALLSKIKAEIPYQQAFVTIFDGNQKIVDYIIVGVDEALGSAYLDYYSTLSDYWCKLPDDVVETNDTETISVINWMEQPKTEFIRDYINARGLKYTLTFRLFDSYGRPRTCISLDRIVDMPFTEDECELVRTLYPHLNNLNKKLSTYRRSAKRKMDILMKTSGLTDRETEIVEMLCQGTTPASISATLCISPGTTRKHIVNIYKKLNVSGIQGLLSRLLY